MPDFIFPRGFLWGASTSSHQVEGGNTNNDWWAWEQAKQRSECRSGEACDQWNRWQEDVELISQLEHSAHRLSIEWSRIEPEEGVFDEVALAHYREVLRELHRRNIKTIVTLHHFTNPKWLAEKGGWRSSCVVKRFIRYVQKTITFLGADIDYLITINEPTVYAFMSYGIGVWPPQHTRRMEMLGVIWRMAQAHKQAYRVVKRLFPHLPVGIAHNMSTFEPVHAHSLKERFATAWLDAWNNRSFYWLTGIQTHDFLGINYYFHRRLDGCGRLWPVFQDPAATSRPVSDLGWELFPEGLGRVVQHVASYNKPILITEHGLADKDDTRRPEFLKQSLGGLAHAIQNGAHVIGYLHWSLLDNFEWADGFGPRFGLVEVDYITQKRTPRPSALVYKTIIHQSSTDSLKRGA